MTDDIELDYDYLMQKALRTLMRDVLQMVADLGDAPGEHHFYIEYLTQAPDVSVPEFLLSDYPERMSIVLQHQFDELTISDEGFAVTLWFKGREARLEIPFGAVTSFADPSVEFGLRFEPVETAKTMPSPTQTDMASNEHEEAEASSTESETKTADGDGEEGGADVVSLDAFRKK